MAALLRPFIVTSWHGAGEAAMPPPVATLFAASRLGQDPDRLNLFSLVLDAGGRLVHAFHGLPGRGIGRSDYRTEIPAAIRKLGLPAPAAAPAPAPARLPDLPAAGDRPGGVRLFIRQPGRPGPPVVEIVPMSAREWDVLSLPPAGEARSIPAARLRSWLSHLYPAAIRTADQMQPFRRVEGELRLEPAGSEGASRLALLTGQVRLSRDADGASTASAFEGTVAVVLVYPRGAAGARGLRGVIEGTYLYRIRGTNPLPLEAAIESRPG